MLELTIPVHQMTCQGCAASVKRVLEHLDGLEQATVDLGRREVVVRVQPGRVAVLAMVSVIEGAGFTVPEPWQEGHRAD